MKAKLLLVAMLVGTAWLISCSKGDNNNPAGSPMVRTISTGDSSFQVTLELSYDSQNRLVSYGFGDTAVISYTYGNGTVTRNIFGIPGQGLVTDIYTLNSKGLAVSSVTFSTWNGSYKPAFPIPGGINGDSTYTTYEYNANGYLTRMVRVDGSSDTIFVSYTILNGNVVTETETSGTLTYTFSYDYFLDKTNTIGNENMGIYFLGKQNMSLVRTLDVPSGLETFSYEFDGKGRVTKQISSSGQNYSFTYTD